MKEKAHAPLFIPILLLAIFLVAALLSCAVSCSAPVEDQRAKPGDSGGEEERVPQPAPAQPQDAALPPLHLTFLGDIMAHDANQATPDLSWIYSDAAPFLLGDDLTFANFETPVSASIPQSTYPAFNAHPAYLEAAVAGGCDAFSLANNHINDHGRAALLETLNEFSALLSKGRIAGFSGLRRKGDEPMRPAIMERKGWKVLFLAATEILNDYSRTVDLIYYTSATKSGREDFKRSLAKMRAENPCDLFVLSLHTNEPEYVIEASAAKRAYFRELATECGVDIIWAHHPHVSQPWELIERGEARPAFAIYSAGNFISAQRRQPNTENPAAAREYTGDAFIFRVVVTESQLTPIPVLVTSYRDTTASAESRDRYFTVRHFNSRFVENLQKEEERAYFEQRHELMRQFLQD